MISLKFKYLLSFIFLICGILWIYHSWGQLETLLDIEIYYITILTPLIISTMVIVGYINQLVVTSLGYRLAFIQWVCLAFASTLANYVFPMRAGMALRAGYFKRYHHFPLNKFMASMAFTYILTFMVNATLGLAIIIFIDLQNDNMKWLLILIFSLVIIVSGIVFSFKLPLKNTQNSNRFMSYVVNIHNGWFVLKNKPLLLVVCSSLILLNTFLFGLRLYVAFCALGYDVTFIGCILMGCFAAVSMFVSITPASLGIREAAIVFVSVIIGVAPELSLLSATLDRAVSIVIVAILGSAGLMKISNESVADF